MSVCLLTSPLFLCHSHEVQTVLGDCALSVQRGRAANAIVRNVALRFMRMFHFKQSSLGTASAVDGAVCVYARMCVYVRAIQPLRIVNYSQRKGVRQSFCLHLCEHCIVGRRQFQFERFDACPSKHLRI